MLDELTQFTSKKKTGIIDVYWLYDDGGLTLLLPYIISTRRNWSSCKLRVFALANRKTELEFEQRNMASLLAKFRIDYSDLQLLPDVTKKPNQNMTDFFKELINDFTVKDDNSDSSTGKHKRRMIRVGRTEGVVRRIVADLLSSYYCYISLRSLCHLCNGFVTELIGIAC